MLREKRWKNIIIYLMCAEGEQMEECVDKLMSAGGEQIEECVESACVF